MEHGDARGETGEVPCGRDEEAVVEGDGDEYCGVGDDLERHRRQRWVRQLRDDSLYSASPQFKANMSAVKCQSNASLPCCNQTSFQWVKSRTVLLRASSLSRRPPPPPPDLLCPSPPKCLRRVG
nr:hypothetical protein Iba_chr03dCG2540 [Ipomoea batatas]